MNDLIRMKSNCLGAVIRRPGFAFIPPASWEHSGLRLQGEIVLSLGDHYSSNKENASYLQFILAHLVQHLIYLIHCLHCEV